MVGQQLGMRVCQRLLLLLLLHLLVCVCGLHLCGVCGSMLLRERWECWH